MTDAQKIILEAMKNGSKLVFVTATDRWRLRQDDVERTIAETTIDSLEVQGLIRQRGPEMFVTSAALEKLAAE